MSALLAALLRALLRSLAATGGSFFETATAEGLAEVFTEIGSQTGSETRDVDISQTFVWLGAGLTYAELNARANRLAESLRPAVPVTSG